MSALASAARALLGMMVGSKKSSAAAAVGGAQRNLSAAKALGNKGDVARAYSNLDRAAASADRADMVAQRGTGLIDLIDTLSFGLAPNSKFSHTVSVSVKGGPEASLRRCWYLCLSALFGRRRRGITALWAEAFNAQWDVTGKAVTATLSYATSTLTDPQTNFIDTESPYAMLQRGPDQVTIGAGFEAWTNMLTQKNFGGAIPRIIGGKLGVKLPALPNLPGRLTDLLQPQRFAEDPLLVGLLPHYKSAKIDPDQMLVGWKVVKGDNDFLQPIFTALFQPWTVRQVTHALAELPINNVDFAFSPQLLPYRSHAPAPLDGIKYVIRGGLLGAVPKIPDEGRVITTGEKLDPRVQPPKPPVDGLSRGHLLMLVSAALGDPGVLVEAPRNLTNNTQSLGAEGLFVAKPGTQYVSKDDIYRIQPKNLFDLVRNVFTALEERPVRGLYVPLQADNLRPPSSADATDGGK